MNKKLLSVLSALTLVVALGGCKSEGTTSCPSLPSQPSCPTVETLAKLPAVNITGVEAGKEYTTEGSSILPVADAEKGVYALENYLSRPDIQYVDLRDPSSYLKGHIMGFENIDYFDFICNQGGEADQLFYKDAEGSYHATYEESTKIIKGLFSQEKTLFLMCQSGARVAFMMEVLDLCGYDMSKVYNVGGWMSAGKVETLPLSTSLDIGFVAGVKIDASTLTRINTDYTPAVA